MVAELQLSRLGGRSCPPDPGACRLAVFCTIDTNSMTVWLARTRSAVLSTEQDGGSSVVCASLAAISLWSGGPPAVSAGRIWPRQTGVVSTGRKPF